MIANLLPAKVRKVVYAALGTAVGLEAIFDVVPDVLEGKLLQAFVVCGFGLALKNTTDVTVVSD